MELETLQKIEARLAAIEDRLLAALQGEEGKVSATDFVENTVPPITAQIQNIDAHIILMA